MAGRGPYLPNLEPFIAMGLDPKTGLPIKMTEANPAAYKDSIRRILRINDEQTAINRYQWYNLPDGLTGHLIERVLYYRGQGAFFYMESLDKFFFLPYALEGEIDVYGQYTGITPLPFNGQMGSNPKEQKPWIRGLVKKPVYDIRMDDMKWTDFTDSCVLLADYSKQLSQTVLPRQQINESLIDIESDFIPFMRTRLLNNTGVMGMRVGAEDEATEVTVASRAVNQAALRGEKYIPMLGTAEFQALSETGAGASEEFLMAAQAMKNFREGTMGLNNGGLFQKKAHELQSESDLNAGGVDLIYQDGLTNRQNFCDIVNSIYGLGIACMGSESVGLDNNGDGQIIDNQDQSGMGEGQQPQEATV